MNTKIDIKTGQEIHNLYSLSMTLINVSVGQHLFMMKTWDERKLVWNFRRIFLEFFKKTFLIIFHYF